MGQMPQQGQPQNNITPQQESGGDIKKLLFSRFSKLSYQEADVFASIITKETYPVLLKVFPELDVLLQQALVFNGEKSQDDYTSPQQQDYIKPTAPQEENPLMDSGVSKGLVR